MNNFDLLKEFIKREDKAKSKNYLTIILAVIGAITAVATIAYLVYRYLNPEYLEDLDEEYSDEYFEDFDDDDYEDFFHKDEEPIVITSKPTEETVEE